MKRTWDAKLFFGRCPYTGNFCKVWECDSCEVEMQEREQAQLLDDREYEEVEKMKIGDEVFVHGYVDEIRKDTVIIRNEGGYFGTVRAELREVWNSMNGQVVMPVGTFKKIYEEADADET